MADDPASRAFAKFCAGGDPQQLGVVFDRLAPELLLVGSRLLPPGADAADLVQQTFLTAIQQRRKFDPQRAVAPWLVGILLQHVRHERRRLRRRLDARRLRAGAAEDPAAVAATREGAEAVRRAVAAMPPPYRQVLQLHLVHGLPVAAIASALERPFRTVQSQLRRGLQQLKRALPAMALAPCPGLASPASLAAVRASVLRAASSLLLGWLWLPWLRLVAAAIALVAVPCVLAAAALQSATHSPPPDATANAARSSLGLGRERAEASGGNAPGAERAQRVLLQEPMPRVCRVRARLLAAEDGAPLAGATLRGSYHDASIGSRDSPTQLPATRADEEGTATLSVPRGKRWLLTVIAEAEGRADLHYSLYVGDGEETALGDVRLPRLVDGCICVRDQHGAPVPFVDVTVGFACQPFTPRSPARGQTGTDGCTGQLQLPLGTASVRLQRLPVDFVLGEGHSVPAQIRGGDCVIVLQRPDPAAVIAGRLLADDGGVIAGGWVQLVRASDEVPVDAGRTPTDGEGRFALRVPLAARGPFRILGSLARQEQGQLSTASYEAGANDAELRLRWPDGLQLTVVDDVTGEPVEEYGIICFRVHAERGGAISGERLLRCEGRHPHGVVFVDRLEAGPSRLLVLPPEGDERLPSGYLPLQIADNGLTRMQVRLHRPQPVRVRLLFGDGAAVAHSRVRLRARLDDVENVQWNVLRAPRFWNPAFSGCIDLATAVTDERGLAELPWQPWREPVVVRADGPGHVPAELVLPCVEPGVAPIDLRVARGSTIRGSVASFGRLPELAIDSLGRAMPEAIGRLRPAIVLRNGSDGSLWKDPHGEPFAIGDDGRFVCADVPPGLWQVLFWHWIGERGVPNCIGQLLMLPLAEVATTAGRDCTTGFDLTSVLPGSLRGRVFLDGQPIVPAMLTVSSWGVDHAGRPKSTNSGWSLEQFVQPDGSYCFGRVPPGKVGVDATIDGKRYRLLERFALAAGEHRQADLQFRHLVARIRLQRADGSPVGHRSVHIEGESLTTDADGWITLDPVPALRCEVALYRADIRSRMELFAHGPDRDRVTPKPIGSIELDPAQPRSEHRLLVRD